MLFKKQAARDAIKFAERVYEDVCKERDEAMEGVRLLRFQRDEQRRQISALLEERKAQGEELGRVRKRLREFEGEPDPEPSDLRRDEQDRRDKEADIADERRR